MANTQPFDQLWIGINIYRIDVVSIESGADDPIACGGTGAMPKTYFDASFCGDGIRQRLLVVNNSTVRSTANNIVPEWDVLLVIVNSPIYGGTGGEVGVFSNTAGFSEVAIHEIGHTAFGLADEYEYSIGCDSGETGHDVYTGNEPIQPNITIDDNKNSIKWRRFILDSTKVPTTENVNCTKCDQQQSPVPPGTVGAFEGAYYYHCGAYRPEFNCKMRVLGYPFCKVCQYVIKEKLLSYVAEYDAHVAFSSVGSQSKGPIKYKSTREPINPLTVFSITNRADDWRPSIACVNNNIYIAYKNDSSNHIFLSKSTNFGDSFQPENIIVYYTRGSGDIELTATADMVYVVWSQYVQPQNEAIFFRRSTDGGATFPSNPNTENLAYGFGYQHQPKIAAWENLVFLLWSGNSSGIGDPDQHVILARSTDNGLSFSYIDVIGGGNWFPDMAVSQIVTRPGEPPIVSVVWTEPGQSKFVYYRRSTDGGKSFSPPLILAANAGSSPKVDSYYDHTIHVMYSQDAGPTFYRISTDYGASFGPPRQMDIFVEDLAVVKDNVYAIRKNYGPGLSRSITFNKSIDGGQTFGPEIMLVEYTLGVNTAFTPSIAISRL